MCHVYVCNASMGRDSLCNIDRRNRPNWLHTYKVMESLPKSRSPRSEVNPCYDVRVCYDISWRKCPEVVSVIDKEWDAPSCRLTKLQHQRTSKLERYPYKCIIVYDCTKNFRKFVQASKPFPRYLIHVGIRETCHRFYAHKREGKQKLAVSLSVCCQGVRARAQQNHYKVSIDFGR